MIQTYARSFLAPLVFLCAGSLALTACGSKAEDSSSRESSPDIAAKAESGNEADTEMEQQDPAQVYADLAKLSVVGVSVGMSVEEVTRILLERGFALPEPNSGAPVGSGCDGTDPTGCHPGNTERDSEWGEQSASFKKDTEDGGKEYLYTSFFIDANHTDKLYRIRYTRNYPSPVFPPSFEKDLTARYPNPYNSYVNDDRISMTYRLTDKLPDGTPVADAHSRKVGPVFEEQTIYGKTSEIDCLKYRLKNFTEPVDEWCGALLNMDRARVSRFFSIAYDEEYMKIVVEPESLAIDIYPTVLSQELVRLRVRGELEEKIAELTKRSEESPKGLSDL
tara:strand:- start:1147 stop:2151 length:1005 start_codon:yes stop_codon:yes gene_type:complete